MAHNVVMPKLGNTVETCIVNAWLVAVGQEVLATTPICEIETDKSSVEIPAGVDGTVLALLVAEGDEVPVLAPVAIVGAPGEAIEDAVAGPATTGVERGPVAHVESAVAPASSGPDEGPAPLVEHRPPAERAISPRARQLARNRSVPVDAVAEGSGPHGRVIARDVVAAADAGLSVSRVAAATLAATNEPAAAVGTGIGGRVVAADLDTAATPPAGTDRQQTTPMVDEFVDSSIRGIRKLISTRMVESLTVAAQVSYQVTAPAAGLLALRAKLKATDPTLGLATVTIGDLVAFAAARVAARHRPINAHVLDDTLRTFSAVHLGLAVDTPRGLMVPTIRDASTISLREFSARSKSLAAEAQEGSISPDLLAGATFTVTNLGSFGVEGFTPIVNVPQTSILGVGAITSAPVELPGDAIGLEKRISFSLTADHRVVDGADAARYLRDLVSAIAAIDITVLS